MPPIRLSHSEIAAYYAARLPGLRQTQTAEWRGPCPVHQGKRDSFSVNVETGAAYCHSQCSRGWSLVELEAELHGGSRREAEQRVRDIVGQPGPSGPQRIVATYDYTDENGKLLYQVVRYEPKGFRQRTRNARGGWTWRVKGIRQVPYRLPRILTADEIFVIEGEKDVHTLEKWGLTATSNAGGAGKWRPELAQWFSGKDVIILPDNDAPGLAHARQVERSLAGLARSVRIVELPGLPEKGDVTDWVLAGGTLEELQRLVRLAASAPASEAEPPPELANFRRDGSGSLYWVDPKGEAKDLYVSPPLEVLAVTRDFQDASYGKLVSFRDTEGRGRQAVILHTRLAADGNEALDTLIHQGFHPSRSRRARECLKDWIWYSQPSRRIRTVNQIGWHRGAFVFPERTIGRQEEEVLFFSEAPIAHKLQVAGTLEDWQRHVGRLCQGNSRLAFAVCCALAASLLTPLDHECIGFHLRGLSSTGKTTALRAAGSVWGGGGPEGFLQTWRSTANGLEAQAAIHNDALLCLDEISQVAEKIAGEIVYFLGNGAVKARMTKSITARQTVTFRLIYLSTGERSLAEIIRAGGQLAKAGQELRLAEIPADAGAGMGMFQQLHDFGKPHQLADAVWKASLRYYGTPILAFLERLTARLSESMSEVRETQRQFTRSYVAETAAGEVYRLANSFGLIAGAGELATRLGVTGWKDGEARAAVRQCFLAWLYSRGSIGSLDVEHGIQRVREFIERHGGSRFQDMNSKDNAVVPNRAGFREKAGSDFFHEDDTGAYTWLIHEHVFQDEVCGPYDYKATFCELVARGMAKRPDSGNHLATQRRAPGLGRARFYVVLPTIFQDEVSEPFENGGDSGDSGDSHAI